MNVLISIAHPAVYQIRACLIFGINVMQWFSQTNHDSLFARGNASIEHKSCYRVASPNLPIALPPFSNYVLITKFAISRGGGLLICLNAIDQSCYRFTSSHLSLGWSLLENNCMFPSLLPTYLQHTTVGAKDCYPLGKQICHKQCYYSSELFLHWNWIYDGAKI